MINSRKKRDTQTHTHMYNEYQFRIRTTENVLLNFWFVSIFTAEH
jgi:hypothetical protein